jgi:hypothetical protein
MLSRQPFMVDLNCYLGSSAVLCFVPDYIVFYFISAWELSLVVLFSQQEAYFFLLTCLNIIVQVYNRYTNLKSLKGVHCLLDKAIRTPTEIQLLNCFLLAILVKSCKVIVECSFFLCFLYILYFHR